MDARFVQIGDSIDYTPSTAVDAGDVIVLNNLVGIAKLDIAANALGALAISGVFDMPKATTSTSSIAVGKIVYWDSGNDVVTETSSGNTLLGKTVKVAADADETVRVKINI